MTAQRHGSLIPPWERIFRFIRDGDVYEDYRHSGGDYRVHRWFHQGNAIEMRDWECPQCGSTNTSVLGSPSLLTQGEFLCLDCSAEGVWNLSCYQTIPIHLTDHCDCAFGPDVWDETPKAWPPDVFKPTPLLREGCSSANGERGGLVTTQDRETAAKAYLAKMVKAAERIGPIPVSRVDKVDEWTTADGDLIVEYEHYRDYPPPLRLPRIVPGQTTEVRGWKCAKCGSKGTSIWGVTTVVGVGTFECGGCGVVTPWDEYCRLNDGAPCDCPVDHRGGWANGPPGVRQK